VQLTTDPHRLSDRARVGLWNRYRIGHAATNPGNDTPDRESHYSPTEVIRRRAIPSIGNPQRRHISTHFVERQNLTRGRRSTPRIRISASFRLFFTMPPSK
jgi:hypothetical protein